MRVGEPVCLRVSQKTMTNMIERLQAQQVGSDCVARYIMSIRVLEIGIGTVQLDCTPHDQSVMPLE